MTINRPFPFDKVFLFIFLLCNLKGIAKIRGKQRFFLVIAVFLATISFLVNYPEGSIQIYYPILFIIAGIIIANNNLNLRYIRNIFTVNIVFGIVCAIMADIGIENDFARDLHEKGFPFLYGPLGFSSTNQVYGTFCILHLLISYEIKKVDMFSLLSVIGLLLTMNRASWVFLLCLWFWYRRKTLFVVLLGVGYVVMKYWKLLEDVFDTTSLDSRDELREGVERAFWKSKDLLVLLFGYGNSNTSEDIAELTTWKRTYVENGLDFIGYAYGYVGLTFVGLTLFLFLSKRFSSKTMMIFSFFFIYLIFEQWLTQEFLASSFMFFFAIMIIIERHFNYQIKMRKKRKIVKPVNVDNVKLTEETC